MVDVLRLSSSQESVQQETRSWTDGSRIWASLLIRLEEKVARNHNTSLDLLWTSACWTPTKSQPSPTGIYLQWNWDKNKPVLKVLAPKRTTKGQSVLAQILPPTNRYESPSLVERNEGGRDKGYSCCRLREVTALCAKLGEGTQESVGLSPGVTITDRPMPTASSGGDACVHVMGAAAEHCFWVRKV